MFTTIGSTRRARAKIPKQGDLQSWCPDCNPWLIAAAVMLPTFMEVLDTSIASVALPHIAGSLSATTDEATWVLTSYLVANAVVLPASSWFSLRFGRRNFLFVLHRRIYRFVLCMRLGGKSLGMMLLARAVQGAGGGALQPLSQAILLESFPPQEAWLRDGAFRARRSRRARLRTYFGRLAHRPILLALGFLYQHPDRHSRHLHDHPIRQGSALYRQCQAIPHRRHRTWIIGRLDRKRCRSFSIKARRTIGLAQSGSGGPRPL